ncbi:MAG: hypothetical protein ACYDHH_27815 [Solirubrobacteraceae bacterium]
MSTQVEGPLMERPAGTPVPAPSSIDRTPQLWCAWCGPIATVGAIVGMVVVSGFIPAQSPSESGPTIAHWYTANVTGIRLGMVISMIAFTLFIPFGIAITLQTRRTETRPVMTYIQIACVAIAALEGVMATFIWVAAAFRPDAIQPNITRALNDLGWFGFLLDVPPFSVWLGAIGIAILRDRRPAPVFPRWLGYLNLWVALLICPALLIPFFKTGPFAYNGLLALYVPFGSFFAWMVITTPCLILAIKRERSNG